LTVRSMAKNNNQILKNGKNVSELSIGVLYSSRPEDDNGRTKGSKNEVMAINQITAHCTNLSLKRNFGRIMLKAIRNKKTVPASRAETKNT